jgi:hypothetical protein
VPGTLPAGVYQVSAAYVSPDGRESGAPKGSAVTLAQNSAIEIDLPSVPAGHSVRFFVTPPGGRDFFLAAETTDRHITWHGPIDALSAPLKTQHFNPPPRPAESIAFWDGRVWVAAYDQSAGFTRIFPSQPMDWHYFAYDDPDAVDVPGRVTVMAGTQQGLLVGTDQWIWLVSADEVQMVAAEYPAMAQQPAYDDNGQVYIWTQRGIARYPPFENITEPVLSVAPGTAAAVVVRDIHGYIQVIAAPSEGGAAFNPKVQSVAV